MAVCVYCERHQRWITFISCGLAASTLAFGWYWANLYTFTISYIKNQQEPGSAPIASWVMPIWFAGCSVGNIVGGELPRLIGKRPTLFFGFCLHCIGITMTYFLISYSELLLYIFLGLICGIGHACSMLTLIQIMIEWSSDRSSLCIGFIYGACILGCGGINHFVTCYINPDNQTPDVQVGSIRYFTQEDVLHRTPLVYLCIGGYTFVLQLISWFFIKENSEPYANTKPETISYATFGFDEKAHASVIHDSQADSNINIESTEIERGSNRSPQNLTPKEILKTREFYVIFATVALGGTMTVIVNNYYKAYGQLWIHDDMCLTVLVDLFLIFLTIGYFAWIMILDRVTIKTGLIVYFGSLSFLNFLIFFAPYLNKWLYFITVLLYAVDGAPLFVIYSIVVAKAFGKTHFSRNYALVTLFALITSISVPVIIKTVIELAGWFYVFLLTASVNLVALLLVTLVPTDRL